MSEAWDEITGSKEKPEKKLVQPTPVSHKHEPEEITAERRAKCLEAIFRVIPDAKMHESGMVSAKVSHKEFWFWPASNTWLSHSAERFGYGIEELVEKIEKHLIQKE